MQSMNGTSRMFFKKKENEPQQLMSKREIARLAIPHEACVSRIKTHLEKRRIAGEIGKIPGRPKIFIAVKNCNWEKEALVDSWKEFAEVVHYDWGDSYDQYSSDWPIKRIAFCDDLYSRILKEHRKSPIHIFFSYLSGRWVSSDRIRDIRDLGIITINYDYDDTLKFWGFQEPSGLSGSGAIANSFDICISAQSESNIGKYIGVGANPLFLPSGANPVIYAASEPHSHRSIEVSFVGQNYGRREEFIRFLRENGVAVVTKGVGWPDGPVGVLEMLEIFRKSLVVLGFGFLGESKEVALKGRDFEVPMAGVAYLTTLNSDLQKYFTPNKEILFYKNKLELLKKTKFLINNPEIAFRIGRAARYRALQEHSWQHRWRFLLGLCK